MRSVRCEKEYLTRIRYGNAHRPEVFDRFWLDGALRISAWNQVDFLKTVSKRASVQGRASASVKDIMIVEAGAIGS